MIMIASSTIYGKRTCYMCGLNFLEELRSLERLCFFCREELKQRLIVRKKYRHRVTSSARLATEKERRRAYARNYYVKHRDAVCAKRRIRHAEGRT